MFPSPREAERKRLDMLINLLIFLKPTASSNKIIGNVFKIVLNTFQSVLDQENDKDEAPGSPVSPSGRPVLYRK